jgi:L-ectoine synthase
MSSDQIRWSRQEDVKLTWVHQDKEFSHRLITKNLHGSRMSFHITTYVPHFDTMVEGDGVTEVILYCLHGWSEQIVEDTGERRKFQQGDAMFLPKNYTYRHIIGEAGLVVAVCASPSKEAGDL